MKLFGKKDRSLVMSLPEERELYGVKIVKLPIGRYLRAISMLERLPEVIAKTIMPELGGSAETAEKIIKGDREFIELLLFRVISVVPQEICAFISELFGIELGRLLDPFRDDALTLKELTDIILAFWELNDLSGFFGNVRKLRMKLTARKTTENTGYSAGSQSDKA